ncbi:hypothetical protein CAPTEDRAFT_203010 [Capitella teleta]|uniref:G-protein coupled receptors family 1 profile domain-containing protein n=1 Tax=Capitella teleta TaxID=283909 RepID=R7TVT5_CAPTE|nr:hypothetical protein CAPTEDRAFT_203010 [Capitella teleta]|eukprot:ELT95120.1 hypothetical protein CAPTEDRAFT_203010 [Capitella teleta]
MNSTSDVAITDGEQIVMKWISVFLGLIGAISNTYTIVCIARYRYLRSKVTNILIGNLCMCGVLLAVTPVISVFNWSGKANISSGFIASVIVAALYMSLLIILLIGVDRMIAVADPIGYKIRMTQKKTGLALVIMWISCMAFSMGFMMSTTNQTFLRNTTIYKVSLPLFTAVIVFAVIAIYVGILIEFTRRQKRAKLQFSGQFFPAIRRSRYLTKMTLFILIIFLATWLPTMIVTVRGPPAEGSSEATFETHRWASHITNAILHASAFTNCLVYAFTNPEYRKAYRDLLRCTRGCLWHYYARRNGA